MMTRFFISLADAVDYLICDKKAVHCTSETVEELDNLSGLDWDNCEYLQIPDRMFEISSTPLAFGKRVKVTPFDIAYGWLKLSQAPVKEYDSGYGSGGFVGAWSEEIYRSAQYAELACLCMRMKMEYGNNESFVSGPYNGSLQGAIIAWNFMYNQLNSSRHYNKALSNGYFEELLELTK